MKKLLSIALLSLFLLNVIGYYAVFLGLQYRNGVAIKTSLDSDGYDESKLQVVKIPLTIPYMNDDDDFERVDGKFEHEGSVYRLVKQKYAKDTLSVVFLNDTEHMR